MIHAYYVQEDSPSGYRPAAGAWVRASSEAAALRLGAEIISSETGLEYTADDVSIVRNPWRGVEPDSDTWERMHEAADRAPEAR